MRKGRVPREVVSAHFEHQAGPGLEQRARGEDLDFHGSDFARCDRSGAFVRVPWTPGAAPRGILLAMRDAQPSFGDAVAIEAVVAEEEDLAAAIVELAQEDEEVEVVALRGRNPELERHAPSELGLCFKSVDEARALPGAGRIVARASFLDRRCREQLIVLRIEKERRVADALQRPRRLGAHRERRPVAADLQPHARLGLPPVGLALDEAVEEPALQRARFFAVERLPLSPSVSVEPLLLRADALEAFERAARVQSMI